MSHESEIKYSPLCSNHVNAQIVEDINRLLPQLSARAGSIGENALRTILGSDTQIFIATDDERVVGTVLLCATYTLTGRKDWIEDVMVDGSYRRRGIAEKLMKLAEDASRTGGAKSLTLTSHAGRTSARAFYAKLGYEMRDTGVFGKVW